MRKYLTLCRMLIIITAITLLAHPASASITLTASGTSAKDIDVTFAGQLTISGDILTVTLTNDSPVFSLNPDDVLASFYFDILDINNNRPNLTFSSAVGDVYLTDKDSPDELQTANADIKAVSAKDNRWMYKPMDPTQTPFLGFGIGTIGNSNLTPNNFQGNIVNGMEFAIYKGDITTRNLHCKLLVKDTATFTFTGVNGYSENDISKSFAFGLGTAPDSLLTPEPATIFLLALCALCVMPRNTNHK